MYYPNFDFNNRILISQKNHEIIIFDMTGQNKRDVEDDLYYTPKADFRSRKFDSILKINF